MAERLVVNGRDLSAFMNLQHDGGLDPVDVDRITPQFSGAPALGEGQRWAADSVGNREGVFPLVLKADSVDELLGLVRDINGDLGQGGQVEYQPEGATNTTYLDLERGRLDPQYQYFLHRKAYLRAKLTLWTRPYGHTGTMRLVASSFGSGPQQVALGNVLGDVRAESNIRIGIASQISDHMVVAWGVHRSASYLGIHDVASGRLADDSAALGTVVGGSGAIGSQYRAFAVVPTNALQQLVRIDLHPHGAFSGRHRALLVYRSAVSPASAVRFWGEGRFGSRDFRVMIGATQSASQVSASQWSVADLGEFAVAQDASGGQPLATQFLRVYYGGASGASAVATRPFQVNAVLLVPLGESAGMFVGTAYSQPSYSFKFEAVPQRQVIENASRTVDDVAARYRGAVPRMPVTGSPAASGAPQLVAYAGLLNNFLGNDRNVVSVAVRERFQFFR